MQDLKPKHDTTSLVVSCAAALLLSACVAAEEPQAADGRHVFVNSEQLPDGTVAQLERTYRIRIADGRYWYDNRAGSWGIEGGPTLGLTYPGLALGGQLRADASAGDTAVFINGRELHRLEVLALSQLGRVVPGRYWADALGNVGYEGGPAFLNLYWLAQQRMAAGARVAGPWAQYSNFNTGFVGGDANGCLYSQFGEYTHSNC